MEININGKNFPAEIMTTPDEITKGMMGRESINGCMVFKLKKGFHSFWMRGCKIPLDIVFVLDNKISNIYSNCQPCDGNCEERFNGIADHVIEFPAGTSQNWKLGDRVKMYLGSPQNPLV